MLPVGQAGVSPADAFSACLRFSGPEARWPPQARMPVLQKNSRAQPTILT